MKMVCPIRNPRQLEENGNFIVRLVATRKILVIFKELFKKTGNHPANFYFFFSLFCRSFSKTDLYAEPYPSTGFDQVFFGPL